MSITPSPVTHAPNAAFPASNFGIPQSVTIYNVGQLVPERIEAVYCVATFPANPVIIDRFLLQICDASGVVVNEQVTPPLLGVDGAVLVAYLSWSRQGNDTAQLAAQEQLFSVDNIRRVWCNMRLPDLVLQPQSFVNLVGWFDDGAEANPVLVTDISITTTQNAGAVSTTSALDTFPLLLPLADS